MQELLAGNLGAGSIGVIEKFFNDKELVADDSPRAGRKGVITPAEIVGYPWEPLESALSDTLTWRLDLEDYRQALHSDPTAPLPRMLITDTATGGYHTLKVGRSMVAYFGRVLVDDPLPATFATDERRHKILAWLAEVRPLVAGGYITFFPLGLGELFPAVPDIAKERAQRAERWEDVRRREIHSLKPGDTLDPELLKYVAPYTDMALDQLRASVGLGVKVMDTTGDNYVLRYLSESLKTIHTRLASVRLPNLESLPSRDLAALLSSDESFAAVHSALTDALDGIPDGLARDPKDAARWVDKRLADDFETAVHQLQHSARWWPDATKIGGAAVAVGASVLASDLAAGPAKALAVGGAGAAAEFAADWLHQWRQHKKQQPAIRVLTYLASRP